MRSLFGGGGPSTGDLLRRAEQQEQQRLMGQRSHQQRVDSMFDDPARSTERRGYADAVRDSALFDLDRGREDTTRGLVQALARRGLVGGSVHHDAIRGVGEADVRGRLQAEAAGRGAYEDLRGQDEAMRSNLLGMGGGAGDIAAALQRGITGMGVGHAAGSSQAGVAGLGNVFGNLLNVYGRRQETQARDRARSDVYDSLYGRR